VELAIHRRTESLIEDNMVVENLFDYDDMVVVAETQNPWTRRRRIELAEWQRALVLPRLRARSNIHCRYVSCEWA